MQRSQVNTILNFLNLEKMLEAQSALIHLNLKQNLGLAHLETVSALRPSRLFMVRLFIPVWLQIMMGKKCQPVELLLCSTAVGSETEYILMPHSHYKIWWGEHKVVCLSPGTNWGPIWKRMAKKQRNKVSFLRKTITLTATATHIHSAPSRQITAKTHKLQGYDKCPSWRSGYCWGGEGDKSRMECTEAFQLYQ